MAMEAVSPRRTVRDPLLGQRQSRHFQQPRPRPEPLMPPTLRDGPQPLFFRLSCVHIDLQCEQSVLGGPGFAVTDVNAVCFARSFAPQPKTGNNPITFG